MPRSATDGPDPLPDLAIQYADYAVWQRRWLSEAMRREQATIGGARSPARPLFSICRSTARVRPSRIMRARPRRSNSTSGSRRRLKALSLRRGTTLFMTILAGWAALLSRLSGQEDVVIGAAVANRGRVEIEPLIGFFVNSLALRVDLSGRSFGRRASRPGQDAGSRRAAA